MGLSAGYLDYGLAGVQLAEGLQNAQLIDQSAGIQQEVANLNGKYAAMDAYNAQTMGYTQSARYQDVVDQTLDQQKEDYASEGVNVNFGSAAQVQANTRTTGVINTLNIQAQARAKALGFTQQSRNDVLQGVLNAGQAQVQGAGAETQAVFGALKTGVTGYGALNNKVPADGTTLDLTDSVNEAGDSSLDTSNIA